MSTTEPVMLNPFEPGFFDDPYAHYARVRAVDPVHHSPLGAWMLLRYDDVVKVLRDPSMSVEEGRANLDPAMEERVAQFEGLAGDAFRNSRDRSMLDLDPPDHDRLRRLVSKAFNPAMIRSLRPRIQELVDAALDAMAERGGEADVIADLAFPLPFTVISEMLGMPDGDRHSLREWSHAMVKTLDPIISDDEIRAALAASEKMTQHVLAALEWKRREPADDLLTALLAAEDAGDALTEDELLAQVVLLYVAGHETTVNLIGNGTLALLRHPSELARLRDDPELDQNAVEELLRFDGPVQFSRRVTLQALRLGDTELDPGSIVLTCLGAANHDPAYWGPTAGQLDLGREGAPHHVTFGGGVHHCLGAALARVEGQVALGTLARRFPGLALAEPEVPAAWNGRVVLRGLDRLPVTLD